MAAAEDISGARGGDARRPIGRIFVEKGLVTQHQLDLALAKQAETNERLGEVLVDLGFIDRLDLASALSRQWANGDLPVKARVRPVEDEEDGELDRLRSECDALRKQAAALREELARHDAPVEATAGRHFLLVPGPNGYSLLERDGEIPQRGEAIPLRFADGRVESLSVTKLAHIPLPEPVPCVYLAATTSS